MTLHPTRKVLTPFHGPSAENRLRKGKSFEFTASRQVPVFMASGDCFRTGSFFRIRGRGCPCIPNANLAHGIALLASHFSFLLSRTADEVSKSPVP